MTSIPAFAQGETPVFQTLGGYPGTVQADRASVVRGHLNDLSAFQATIRAVRDAPVRERKERALALCSAFAPEQVKLPSMALELIHTLRDFAEWSDVLVYMDGLPASIRELPILREQRCLAQSKTGDHVAAIAALNELISTSGDSSERQGLLGGRYKRLFREAIDAADKPRYLSKAVEHYARGMMLDLNDYFPACNLPPLYLVRGRRGDDERARAAATVARLACQRAIGRGADDEWTRPTLLGLAFVEGDLDAVDELCDQVSADGAALWKVGIDPGRPRGYHSFDAGDGKARGIGAGARSAEILGAGVTASAPATAQFDGGRYWANSVCISCHLATVACALSGSPA